MEPRAAELAQAVALKPPRGSRLLFIGTSVSMATEIRPQILRDFAEKIKREVATKLRTVRP